MATGSLRPSPSTAAVNRLIGRVSEFATSTASAAAHNTAISPTRIELRWIGAAAAMKTVFGTISMIPTHCLPARMAGAIAAPPGRPAGSGTIWASPFDAPSAAAKYGKSLCQFAGVPSWVPNSRAGSG
jgi:hypothetical protein